jgi:hypothetical protein
MQGRLVGALLLAVAGASQVVTCPAGANCTAILQSAIDAGGDMIVSGAFSVLPIALRRSDQTITFAAGSSVVALPGAFHDTSSCLFSMDAQENVTILGYGASWAMHRSDYNNSAEYAHSEHRHALSIISSVGVTVRGLHISETGGDGVYLVNSKTVEVRDVTTEGAYRNGFSLIAGSDVLVAGCRFLRTAGTAPEAGIDIEPNNVKPGRRPEQLAGIVFEDIECRHNLGCGLSFSLGKLTAADVLNISVSGLVVEGAVGQAPAEQLAYNVGILVNGEPHPNATNPGELLLNNASVTNTAQPGLEVYGKLAAGAKTTVRGLRLDGVAVAPTVRWGGQNVPILLHQSKPDLGIGGIFFDDLVVSDSLARPFLKCDSCDSRGNATGITGSAAVHNPHHGDVGCSADWGHYPQHVDLQVDCNNASSSSSSAAEKVSEVPSTRTSAPRQRLRMIVPMYMQPGEYDRAQNHTYNSVF